ncbi:hypothetical protein ATANTOWER_011384 [Ataeniobius toweri]|uniref:Uncharacterized protein n=1 Tax=Ataeniobius toweri TaxID=208326 RepID=A0ABU7AZR5_9TELE|nr:hypothetical protein [Ataeniobius toweri]
MPPGSSSEEGSRCSSSSSIWRSIRSLGSKSQLWILPQSDLQILQETYLTQVLADSSSLPPSNSPPPWTDSQTRQLHYRSPRLHIILPHLNSSSSPSVSLHVDQNY